MLLTSAIALGTLCFTVLSSPVTNDPRSVDNNAFDKCEPRLQNFNALGAWFQEVAAINCTASDDSDCKNATIAIVGAGISGMATDLMLDSVGVHNWEIFEASDRVGGRFRTKYIGGTEEWAEMGPMRLPYSITYNHDETLEYTEHHMAFQLAETLNKMNNDTNLKVDFIPWIQHHPNELRGLGTGRHPDGRIPTRAEPEANPKLGRAAPLDTQEYKDTKTRMDELLKNKDTLKSVQRDVWRAHKATMNQGLDDWSQQSMLRNSFGASENVTDAIWTASDYDVLWDEIVHNSNLAQDGGPASPGLTNWKCIGGGFNRLSDAFLPHILDRLHLSRKVRKLEAIQDYNNRTRTRLSWFPSPNNRTFESKDFDYTIMAVPFTMTRFMQLPQFSSVPSRAIGESGFRFKSAWKVSLLFSERFWEKGGKPIFGGYSTPPNVAVGALYYPAYGLNESRPGLIIHYRGASWAEEFISMPEDEHVQLVLDAIVSLHGEQARQYYTGDYERLCWLEDEHIGTAWARPDVAQHTLYIPAYHGMERITVFVGEHTAPTNAWASSAIYSVVRCAVQALLEMGRVDEAKELMGVWMERWIER